MYIQRLKGYIIPVYVFTVHTIIDYTAHFNVTCLAQMMALDTGGKSSLVHI